MEEQEIKKHIIKLINIRNGMASVGVMGLSVVSLKYLLKMVALFDGGDGIDENLEKGGIGALGLSMLSVGGITLKLKQLSKILKRIQTRKGVYDKNEYSLLGIWKPPVGSIKVTLKRANYAMIGASKMAMAMSSRKRTRKRRTSKTRRTSKRRKTSKRRTTTY